MRLLIAGLFLAWAGLVVGCSSDDAPPASGEASSAEPASARADTLVVRAAWARPGRAGGMSALYAEVVNGTFVADTLRAVAAPVASTVEIHESYENEDGTRGMRPVGPVPVPAGEQVALVPGGKHVMLIRLNQALRPDDSLAVDFQFARAGTQSMTVPIRLQPPQ